MDIHTAQRLTETVRSSANREEIETAFKTALEALHHMRDSETAQSLMLGLTYFTQNPHTPQCVIEAFWHSPLTDLIYTAWDEKTQEISRLPACPDYIRAEIEHYAAS